MSHLLPCPSCNRHVKNSEPSCPFCHVELDSSDQPGPALPRGRLGRTAMFAFGATVAGVTALTSCSGETDPEPGSGGAAGATTGGSGGMATAGTSGGGGTLNVGGTAGDNGVGGQVPIYGAAPRP